MVEILEVGSEAETCLMAGRGMNGLRGVVVCYNANNSRYTIELDSGEMMSLRARNVKALVELNDDYSEQSHPVVTDQEEEPSVKRVSNATEHPTKPSALPKYEKPEDTTTDKKRADDEVAADEIRRQHNGGNIVDRIFISIFNTFMDLSPSVVILAIGAGYFFLNRTTTSTTTPDTGSTGGFSTGPDSSDNNGHSSADSGRYVRLDDDYYYHPRRSWWWGYGDGYYGGYYGGWGYWWPWFGLSGIFSLVVVGFFTFQWGTKKGTVDFRWKHFKDRVMAMDFWEVMRYGALLQGAAFFLSRLAQGDGGARMRHR